MAETETITKPETEEAPAPVEKPKEENNDKEVFERSRKPPSKGPCVRCGDGKPINRLMLCYPCWVKTRNEDNGWREGQPHPPGCGCAGECTVESKEAQN